MSTPPPPPTEPVVSTENLIAKATAIPDPAPASAPAVIVEPPKPPAEPTKKICQNEKCKFEIINSDYEWCPKCGTSLEEIKPICPNKKCGFENPKGSLYCCKCRTSLTKNGKIDWLGWWRFIKIVVFVALLTQLAFVLQMYVMSDYQIIKWDNVMVCVAFYIIPAFISKIVENNRNDVDAIQKSVDESNDDIRSAGYKQKEEVIKQKKKQAEFDAK